MWKRRCSLHQEHRPEPYSWARPALAQEAAYGGLLLPYFEAGAEEGAGADEAGAEEEGAGVEVVGAGVVACFAGAALPGVACFAGAELLGVMAAWVWAGRHSRALFFISHWTLRSLSFKPSPTLTW